MRLIFACLAALLFGAVAAHAHSASSAYLQVEAHGHALDVQWSIALRDLDYAVGIDTDGKGAVTWGELRRHEADIDAYAMSRLRLSTAGELCTPGPIVHLADMLGDGGYAVLRFTARCPVAVSRITVHYDLLFDLDRLHRGLLRIVVGGVAHAAVLSPDNREASFDATAGYGRTAVAFFRTGVLHLLTGIDHLLFVTMLLVPAMFMRGKGRAMLPALRFRDAFVETVKVLSAFTLAHAATLTLSVLHIVQIPQRLSEAGIALTILITAIDNIVHVLPAKRWPLAFGFGLIHGLGFANALGPLQLPPISLAVALISFNLGLEAAQILVACIVLPFGFAARRTWLYPHRILPGVSGAVALLALAWFTDRASGLGLMPF